MRSVRKQLFETELGIVFLEAPVIEPVTVRFMLYGIEFVILFFGVPVINHFKMSTIIKLWKSNINLKNASNKS